MDSIPTYLKTHKFHPCHMGNCALFGLNTFGCNSIITVRDVEREAAGLPNHIWKFIGFPTPSNLVADYINEEGDSRVFDFRDPDIYNNTTSLEECEDGCTNCA
jgi:hypothetical protein